MSFLVFKKMEVEHTIAIVKVKFGSAGAKHILLRNDFFMFVRVLVFPSA